MYIYIYMHIYTSFIYISYMYRYLYIYIYKCIHIHIKMLHFIIFYRFISVGCCLQEFWSRDVVVNTSAKLHSSKSVLRFKKVCTQVQILLVECRRFLQWWKSLTVVPAGNNRLRAFCRSTIPQRQLIIIIIIIIIEIMTVIYLEDMTSSR